MKVEINKEVEEKGNFFLLWKEKDEIDNCSDIIDGIEKLSYIQEKNSNSEWKRLKK